MKSNLKKLYELCQLAFASNDDKIMVEGLRGLEKELREILENRPHLTNIKYAMLDGLEAFDIFENDNETYWKKAKKEILGQ